MHVSYHTKYVRKRKDGEKKEWCILLRLEKRQILRAPAVAACKWFLFIVLVRQISISSIVLRTASCRDAERPDDGFRQLLSAYLRGRGLTGTHV